MRIKEVDEGVHRPSTLWQLMHQLALDKSLGI
jgi:hypothetical protein